MTTLEVLIEARDLISDPEHFTQFALARDIEGRHCSPTSMQAVCFCSEGALIRGRVNPSTHEDAQKFLNRACESHHLLYPLMGSYISFSDTNEHCVVIKMWDRAIELAHEAENAQS